jgi:Xaa-Pro dipeptidase
MVYKQEFQSRIGRLQKQLQANELDGAIFAYPVDIYYYAGTRQNSLLWVPAEGTPTLLVRKSLNRAEAEACIDDVRPHPSSRDLPAFFAEAHKIGLTYDVLPAQQVNFFSKILPGKEFADISAINRDLRSVKSDWEQEKLRSAGEKLCAVFAQVPEFLRPGMREIDLAAEFEYRARKAGSEGYVRMRAFNQELFQGLAVAGANAASPGFFDGAVTGTGLSAASPHGASIGEIEPDVPIMVDYTGVFDGYIVDMTRIFVLGTLPDPAQHAFDTALAIQEAIAANLKPGESCAALYELARQDAEEAGLGCNFMGIPGEQARFVGHGVGLELDEKPVLAQGFDIPLQAGQTIAVEPKFVLPGLGVVGIENTFLVGVNGGTVLTDFPDDVVSL